MGFQEMYAKLRDNTKESFANPYRNLMLKIKRTRTGRSFEAMVTYSRIFENLNNA